jgi:hypothetical protein
MISKDEEMHVKENKRFENSKRIKCFQHGTHPELCKPIRNQGKKSKRTFDGREREIEREKERMRKKVEEIHVEDWKSKDCGSKDCGFS